MERSPARAIGFVLPDDEVPLKPLTDLPVLPEPSEDALAMLRSGKFLSLSAHQDPAHWDHALHVLKITPLRIAQNLWEIFTDRSMPLEHRVQALELLDERTARYSQAVTPVHTQSNVQIVVNNPYLQIAREGPQRENLPYTRVLDLEEAEDNGKE